MIINAIFHVKAENLTPHLHTHTHTHSPMQTGIVWGQALSVLLRFTCLKYQEKKRIFYVMSVTFSLSSSSNMWRKKNLCFKWAFLACQTLTVLPHCSNFNTIRLLFSLHFRLWFINLMCVIQGSCLHSDPQIYWSNQGLC